MCHCSLLLDHLTFMFRAFDATKRPQRGYTKYYYSRHDSSYSHNKRNGVQHSPTESSVVSNAPTFARSLHVARIASNIGHYCKYRADEIGYRCLPQPHDGGLAASCVPS